MLGFYHVKPVNVNKEKRKENMALKSLYKTYANPKWDGTRCPEE